MDFKPLFWAICEHFYVSVNFRQIWILETIAARVKKHIGFCSSSLRSSVHTLPLQTQIRSSSLGFAVYNGGILTSRCSLFSSSDSYILAQDDAPIETVTLRRNDGHNHSLHW